MGFLPIQYLECHFDSSKGIFSTNQGECNLNFGHCDKVMKASPVDNAGQPKASTSLRMVSPLIPLCAFVNEPKSPFTNRRPHMIITAYILLKKKNGMQLEGNVEK